MDKERVEERRISSSLCRFRLSDEEQISDERVKQSIQKAFAETRCYPFYPDRVIVESLKAGGTLDDHLDRINDILNTIFDTIADSDETLKTRLHTDVRLGSRIVSALGFFHRALAEADFSNIYDRRIVLVKELAGEPTIYHISPESTVIAHIGQGPPWTEIPSIYLGINTFSTLITEKKKGGARLFQALVHLLQVEERAIESGYVHEHDYPPEVSLELNFLVDEVIKNSVQDEPEAEPAIQIKPVRKFSESQRENLLRQLNARIPGDEMNFFYEKNLKALKTIEYHARRYKRSQDRESLREVIRLLVAASGHDIHEIRNRANLILERIFSPKEYDAPLATHFINTPTGSTYSFSFSLEKSKEPLILRLYRAGIEVPSLESDIQAEEIILEYSEEEESYSCSYTFSDYGHYDYTVYRKKGKKREWLQEYNTSGRVNVIPDVKGEIILEIFVDIHGHTGVYWLDDYNHPGLVYNENGEVLRLGCFSDVTCHMAHLKETYRISAIYLLGVQKRGTNRIDWSAEATSPSPFSPVSLVDIEPSLGGEEGLRELVQVAHEHDIKVIVDIVPHINRRSNHLDDSLVVKTYDDKGNLVARASTDGRYGSWNDGKLLNYRKLEIWEWMARSIETLIEKFDIDGIRFDSAHAVPIVMKKNNYLRIYNTKRSHEDMVEGTIIVNDREFEHFITTGYYDCACRDIISVPFHYYLMLEIEKVLKKKNKNYFLNIAECYWGHERFLTRTGLIPYNSALFKICENIIHGKTDVREVYHIYDNYFPMTLPEGTQLLGILSNHDERRALNTFGQRGLRAAVALTSFMSDIIMDYEGSAEGESWKVYLDNIYVNWNQFEHASHRSVDAFYKTWYQFHRDVKGKGHLLWANNNMVAAALKSDGTNLWIGAFNFAEHSQNIAIQFDNPRLPIDEDAYFRVVDPLYSEITGHYSFFTGRELKISKINTLVSYTERVKLLKVEKVELEDYYLEFSRDSFYRLCELDRVDCIFSNLIFKESSEHCSDFDGFMDYILKVPVGLFWHEKAHIVKLGIKRIFFHLYKNERLSIEKSHEYIQKMIKHSNGILRELGKDLRKQFERKAMVFMSAEAEPFSKSGGLADVVYELPRQMAKSGEEVYVITAYYRHGTDKAVEKMNEAYKKYNIAYSDTSIRFFIEGAEYEVGVHRGVVEGITYYLLDHHEFFDGLYWGFTSEEKVRRRIAFARASAEVILTFNLNVRYTFTNDAFAGLFNGVIRSDPYYYDHPLIRQLTFLHIIHNGGWQYFDAYDRYEKERDLFSMFNLPGWKFGDFADPVFHDRLNCMATAIRFADKTITVSPTYARQIEFASDGLEHVLYNVMGVSNALGEDFKEKLQARFIKSNFVNNAYDSFIEEIKSENRIHDNIGERYPEILKGLASIDGIKDTARKRIVRRVLNKCMLQFERGLDVNPDAILFVMIHRISEQKGFQLLLEASEGIFNDLGFQAIVGGPISSGDDRGGEIAHGLYQLGQFYSKSIHVSFGYQDISVPLMAGDYFGMPSMHEPGGISQLEALASGCPVIARATGGLRDTVSSLRISGKEVQGNGFLFSDYSAWSFYDAMKRASDFYHTCDDQLFDQARQNAADSVYYWDRPAIQYIENIYNMTETIRMPKG